MVGGLANTAVSLIMKMTVTQIRLKSFPKYDSLSFNEPDLRPPYAQSILGTDNYCKRHKAKQTCLVINIVAVTLLGMLKYLHTIVKLSLFLSTHHAKNT